MASSRTSSFRRMPTVDQIKAEHTILLLDQTNSINNAQQDAGTDTERNNSDASSLPTTPAADSGGLYKRLTNNSINLQQSVRRELAKQKYSRYSQDRYDVSDLQAAAAALADDPARPPQDADDAITRGYFERAQARARATLRRKKGLGRGKDERDTVIDVLWENQRGMFFFGIPKYSSSSLLPTDAKPWQNAQFRTSASDIRNAQVPDPSWEWTWKSWYVDMSRDVDEEGWEYSFAFIGPGGNKLAWHGNHPWFNSFVRRRRWLRMRRRRDLNHHTREKAHELTADYFTIHPKTVRPSSLLGSQNRSSTLIPALKKVEEAESVEKMEIVNIADLLLALRRAAVDRERLLAVRKFTDDGGDELIYLSERMDEVMAMLVFQHSRRQLLSDLIQRHEGAHEELKTLAAHQHEDDEEKQRAHDRAARHAEALLQAVHAADEHVKQLEYWSDVKDISVSGVEAEHEEGHEWPSFRTKQGADEGTPTLHKHPEHPAEKKNTDTESNAPTKSSGVWFDALSQQPSPSFEVIKSGDGSEDLERFTTAAETKSELGGQARPRGKGKAKAKASQLDGLQEEDRVEPLPGAQDIVPLGDDAGSHASGL